MRKSYYSYTFQFISKTKTKRLADGVENTYFQCQKCSEIGGVKSRVTVRNNRVITNPDGGHNLLCAPIDNASMEALKLKREIVSKVMREGKRPLQACREDLAEIARQFPNNQQQQENGIGYATIQKNAIISI